MAHLGWCSYWGICRQHNVGMCHIHNVYPVAGVQKKLGLKNVGGFAVSQNLDSPQLAAYAPEGKGSPGYVGVWPLSQLSKNETPPPTARRSFFRVSAQPHHTVHDPPWQDDDVTMYADGKFWDPCLGALPDLTTIA